MRPSDPFSHFAKRLLLAPVFAFGLASIIATGDSGGSIPKLGSTHAAITVSTKVLAVAQGDVAVLRVDIEDLPEGEAASGYAIDLSEEVSRIDIQTSACPVGAGSPSCRDWAISPGLDSVPGEYPMRITTVGSILFVSGADVTISVIGALPPAEPAMVATGRMVVTNDGRLWATGSNRYGQAGVGFWNACTFIGNYRCLQPQSVPGYARVGSASDWTDAASSDTTSLAVRNNDTVWIWGRNPDNAFGFVSTSEAELRPHQVAQIAGLTGARRVSIAGRVDVGGYDQDTFLAMTDAGIVFAWGGLRHEGPIHGIAQTITRPRIVPQSVGSDCIETALNEVVDIAGGTGNTGGDGLALALKGDGAVWQWGRGGYYQVESTGSDVEGPTCREYINGGMPKPVSGLPAAGVSIAVGRRPTVQGRDPFFFALVATVDGEVMTWNEPAFNGPAPIPERVAGLSGIRAVSADMDGNAAALANDGTVWLWRPGETMPQLVSGLPAIAKLGRGTTEFAIAADCGGIAGSLWSLDGQDQGPRTGSRRPPFGTTCGPVPSFQLTVNRTGDGAVVAEPLYLNCGTTCSGPVPANSTVSLRFTPAPGWKIKDGGAASCSTNGNPPIISRNESRRIDLRIDGDTTCAVIFEPAPLPKTLAVSINGGGRVTSEPAGIDCPGNCTETYSATSAATTTVALTAIASPGYRFETFSGDPLCSGSFNMSVSRQCDASFVAYPTPAMPSGFTATASTESVRLTWTGVTDDRVVSYRLERADGNDASRTIVNGLAGRLDSFVDVAVIPGRQYTYRLFAVNVSGESPPALTIAIVGTPATVTLTVSVAGQGSVSSVPAGIGCGADCSEAYPLNASVTLNATATASSRFDGWGGDCAGTAPAATVVMNANKSCTAQFSAVSAGGWQTLASDIAASLVRDLRSSVALDQSGLAYISYLQTVGTQTRLTVRKEGPGFPPLATLNVADTWSATGAQLVIDPAGDPVIVFNVELEQIWVARWNGSTFDLLRDGAGSARLNLTANNASRPRMARAGNTLVLAWKEANQIALRRYNLDTRQFDAGAFVPGPTNPFDIDLALDSNGLAVIAWSWFDLSLGERLQAIRETGPGTWTPLGGDIGVRPFLAPLVVEFGIHVDTNDAIRIVWLEGDTNHHLSLAQFDGAAWTPLPGRPETLYFISGFPVRSLSVNRNPALFAFAFEWDQHQSSIDSLVAVRQLVGGQLTMVGSVEYTIHPRVGHLSLAMNEADRATIAQSEYTPADMTYRLVIRRHVP